MTSSPTPYDELPYRSRPIEWTVPERLALASLLHGGPRQPLAQYRVLELGCGDGANLIPMACGRPHSTFVGIDAAASRIAVAEQTRASLQLTNASFVVTDFRKAAGSISGEFDFIVGHGVFSWVAAEVRDALLDLCAHRLRRGGLLYLNYNARPGWNVRGLIRQFLLSQTARIAGLRARTERAREIAAAMAEFLQGSVHPYSQLLSSEFRFVGELDVSHTAHEYLADHNEAYTRREFLEILRRHGFVYVADADFNYPSGRLPEGLPAQLEALGLDRSSVDESEDLVCYRQVHSPILTQEGVERRPPNVEELSSLVVASCLVERGEGGGRAILFEHPSGCQVEARTEAMAAALRRLRHLWPGGLPIGEIFRDVADVVDDVLLLHRNGVIDLRLVSFGESDAGPSAMDLADH